VPLWGKGWLMGKEIPRIHSLGGKGGNVDGGVKKRPSLGFFSAEGSAGAWGAGTWLRVQGGRFGYREKEFKEIPKGK